MAKRDTDNEKWKKQFFKRLTQSEMLFWLYINDDCDHSGVWYVDLEVAALRIKEPSIDLPKMIGVFNLDEERVILFHGSKKLLIKSFVVFQYAPDPSPRNRLHLAANKTLEAHGFKWFNAVTTPLERPKEAGTGSRKQEVKEGCGKPDSDFDQLDEFNEFWELYPAKGRLNRSASLRVWCEIVVRREESLRIRTALENYSEHLRANSDWGKQPKACLKWLEEWVDWESHQEPLTQEQEERAKQHERITKK